MKSLTTQAIAEHLGGELAGPGDVSIVGVEDPARVGPERMCYVGDQARVSDLAETKPGAVLTKQTINLDLPGSVPVIRVADGDAAFIALLKLFAPPVPRPCSGVHPTAIVAASAKLADGVCVGPYCVVGEHVRIGEGTILQPRVTVYDEVEIGAGCELYPGVVIRERCVLGDKVTIHPNAVIGADGFGYRPAPDKRGEDDTGLVKVPQIGRVVMGDNVEIGANTCIDRGTFGDTVIGKGCKIDNLCQIGHNCRLGRSVLMAGQAGLAGSVEVGDGAMLGGQTGIKDHVRIGTGAQLAASSGVMTDVPDGAVWAGSPAVDIRQKFKEVSFLRKMVAGQKQPRKAMPSGAEKEAGDA